MFFFKPTKKIISLSIFIVLTGCAIYIEDLQKVYVERDGIYKVSENQNILEEDIFYYSFYNYSNYKSVPLENISLSNDFIKLEEDTIYKSYLSANYYSDKEISTNKNINDSIKIIYDRESIIYSENEDLYYKNVYDNNYKINKKHYNSYNTNYYTQYYGSYNKNYWYVTPIYRPPTYNRETSNKTQIIKKNNSPRPSYEQYKKSNNNTEIKNNNEYNRRSTRRRRR